MYTDAHLPAFIKAHPFLLAANVTAQGFESNLIKAPLPH